jgi:thymidylate synthase
MNYVTSTTIGNAWAKAYDLVMKNGATMTDNGTHLKEIVGLCVSIENGQTFDKILKTIADPEMISWMVDKNFGSSEPVLDWGYSYGMRLRDFDGINQIDEVVKKLREQPNSRSATITLTKPTKDFAGHMPCVVAIDLKVRQGKLHLSGFFRSQDIGKKFYADMIALASIQKEVADKLDKSCGRIELLITSAHIFEVDFDKHKVIDSFITLDDCS